MLCWQICALPGNVMPYGCHVLSRKHHSAFQRAATDSCAAAPPLCRGQPEATRRGHTSVVQQLPLRDTDLWFIRFGFDGACRTLACGNKVVRL